MQRTYTYLLEKSSTLIHNLIIGEGNAKQRLFENLVDLHMILGLGTPSHLEELKKGIIKRLTKFPAIKLDDKIIISSYQRSISKMRNSTASKLINDIYRLHLELTWLKDM